MRLTLGQMEPRLRWIIVGRCSRFRLSFVPFGCSALDRIAIHAFALTTFPFSNSLSVVIARPRSHRSQQGVSALAGRREARTRN